LERHTDKNSNRNQVSYYLYMGEVGLEAFQLRGESW